MSTPLAELQRFADARISSPQMRPRVVSALTPLCDVAASGTYRLVSAPDVKPGDIHAALCLALCVPLSVGFITTGALVPARVTQLAWTRLGDIMRDRVLALGIDHELTDAIDAAVVEGLEPHLESAIWECVWEDLPDDFVGRPWLDVLYGIRMTVRAFLALAASGSEQRTRELAPIVRLFSCAIPLGESLDAPGTWAVLIAP